MRETTYTCDRCKEVQKESQDLHVVTFGTGTVRSAEANRLEFCRPCMVALGIYGPQKHLKEVAPDPPRTPLDVIVELIEMLQELGHLPYAD